MNQKPDNNDDGQSPEKNKNNWVWYLFFGGLMVVLLGVVLAKNQSYPISYPDFIELVKNTKYETRDQKELREGYTGTTQATISANAKIKIFYSEPRNIVVGEQSLTGSVKRKQIIGDDEAGQNEKRVDFYVPVSAADTEKEKLFELLNESNINWNNVGEPSWLSRFGPLWLSVLVFLGIAIFLMRRISGVGSPMSFGRSRGRLYAQEDIGVLFDDVAGINEAVEEVREVVDFLKQPEKYQKLGGRIPKGVLLVGPPGTGKTLLAKAIAGEAGVPFFSLSGSDFVEMFVGVGAARVRDMFQQATAKAPCIIFIDELDALGKSRSGNTVGSHDEREQTLNALLVEMDGFDANAGVIVIAATNRPETLDPALLRPGRFDRNVLVDRPDKQGREDILKVHVKSVRLDDEVNLKDVASITPGFVGADLANLVNEAALLAARNGRDTVGQEQFNDGVERVTAGLEKKQRLMNEDEKLRVAYHEAGHALLAYSLPNTDPVHKVSIIPRGMAALGYTMQRPEEDRYLMTQAELEAQMQVLLAGTLTEEMVFRDISTGAQNDLERASKIARGMVMEYGMSRLGRVNYRESGRSPFLSGGGGGDFVTRDYSEQTAREIDQEVKRIIDESIARTRTVLSERRHELEVLTKRLLEIEVVNAEELDELMGANMAGPRVVPGTTASDKATKLDGDNNADKNQSTA